MRVVLQRVDKASVEIDNKIFSKINQGILILVGIENEDHEEDINWLCKKIVQLRIFNDESGIMNKSVQDINGEILTISQFTLHAKTKKGNRPSYIHAAKPDISIPIYEKFVSRLSDELGRTVKTGKFGAMMNISLVNSGPVTILIDSKKKE
ncbi:MAG: D-tyrosyl-tRNA(Tyr) deacylase [Marinilabiliales bacterium]|nr:MAG: D-tyrosyl-tRNA(Tyr) deacylase [Marinilabiliales bacterium]